MMDNIFFIALADEGGLPLPSETERLQADLAGDYWLSEMTGHGRLAFRKR